MELEVAIRGMESAKEALRSKRGVEEPAYMSEHMDRLAVYTNAVEDHLADLEKKMEIAEYNAYSEAIKTNSASASEKIARNAIAHQKGDVKRLTRLVNSAWKLVDEKRSRFNHLQQEARGQI